MVKKEITNEYLAESIKRLMDTYGAEIDSEMVEFILSSALVERDEKSTVDILMQAYDEIGVLNEDNSYNEFIDLLDCNFGLGQDIIEIGGGLFSRLGHRIAKRQLTGKTTVYDPLLVMKKHDIHNLILKKEKFGYDTDLAGSRMLVGISPCEATQIIIDRACKENLDFQISLCPCSIPRHIRECLYDYDSSYALSFFKQYLLDDISEQVSNSPIGKLEIVSFEKTKNPLPIIYNKR